MPLRTRIRQVTTTLAGPVILATLARTPNLARAVLRRTVSLLSKKLRMAHSTFVIPPNRAQAADRLGVTQFRVRKGSLTPAVVYPTALATGKASAAPDPRVS